MALKFVFALGAGVLAASSFDLSRSHMVLQASSLKAVSDSITQPTSSSCFVLVDDRGDAAVTVSMRGAVITDTALDRTLMGHVHEKSCSADPVGGAHWHYGPEETAAEHELWVNVTLNEDGDGSGFGTADTWAFSDLSDPGILAMASVVLHSGGTKVLCCDLTVSRGKPAIMEAAGKQGGEPSNPTMPSAAGGTKACEDFSLSRVPISYYVAAVVVLIAVAAAGVFVGVGVCNWRRGQQSHGAFHNARGGTTFDPLPKPSSVQ